MPRPNPSPMPDAFTPVEPLIAIAVQPPSPPFSGRWANSTVIYSGERILELDYVGRELLADYRAEQEAWIVEAQAADVAWADRRKQDPPPSPEERAARTADVERFALRQRDLNRQALLPIARYLVWKITDQPEGKGTTYVGGPDQIGWDTLPTAILLWLTERGKAVARNELDGPLPGP